jgi:hypothetical protein
MGESLMLTHEYSSRRKTSWGEQKADFDFDARMPLKDKLRRTVLEMEIVLTRELYTGTGRCSSDAINEGRDLSQMHKHTSRPRLSDSRVATILCLGRGQLRQLKCTSGFVVP